jgi:hypothetical protein
MNIGPVFTGTEPISRPSRERWQATDLYSFNKREPLTGAGAHIRRSLTTGGFHCVFYGAGRLCARAKQQNLLEVEKSQTKLGGMAETR